jgi:hypothetical protein
MSIASLRFIYDNHFTVLLVRVRYCLRGGELRFNDLLLPYLKHKNITRIKAYQIRSIMNLKATI